MFELPFLNDLLLLDYFHGIEFLGAPLFDKEDRPEATLAENNLGNEVIDGDIFVFGGKECFCRFTNNFFFFIFVIGILFIGFIVMKLVFAFDLLNAIFLLVFLSHRIDSQTDFLPIVNRHLLSCHSGVGLQNVVDYFIPLI